MVCKNCGKELSEGANFCSACGAPCNGEPAAGRTSGDSVSVAAQGVPDSAQMPAGSREAAEAAFGSEDSVSAGSREAARGSEDGVPAAGQVSEGGAADTHSEGTADSAKTETAKTEAAAVVKKAAEASRDAIVNGVRDHMAKAPDNTQKLLFITLGSVMAVCLLIVLCVSLGSSPKKAFNAYVQGEFACDYQKVINNSIAAKKAQKALDVYDKDDYEDEFEDLKDYYEDQKDDWEDDGIKYKVKIDIKDVEKIKKSDKEFKWAQDLMEDYYDCDADKVQQFAIVEAKIKAEYYEDGDRDKDYDKDTGRTQYLLVKLGGTWYMTTFTDDDIRDYLKDYYK